MITWQWPFTLRQAAPGIALRYEQWLLYHYHVLLPRVVA